MNFKNRIFCKLFITFFALSVSAAVLPCGLINVHGLFGEIKSTIITEDSRTDREQLSSILRKHQCFSGENIYNIWFELSVIITFLIFALYKLRLPKEETIVTLKVRMDN